MLPCLTSRAVQFLHSGVPEGRLRGIRAYRQLFDALRLTRNTAVADADLSYHLSLPSEATIRVRWHARLWLRMPLPSLGSIVGVHAAAPLLVDGVSLYELDGDARIAACCSCRRSLVWPRAAPRHALARKLPELCHREEAVDERARRRRAGRDGVVAATSRSATRAAAACGCRLPVAH